jgi:predicted GTPase
MYSKLDVRRVYNLLRVKEGDEHKLAFWTPYGLYEPTVLQFGTTNAPAEFQDYINNMIREALDDFASAYLDDVLMYTDSEEEHVSHIK